MSMFAQSYDKPNETILAQGNFNYYYHKEDTNVNDALFHLWWDLELNGDAVALVAPTVIPGIPDFSIKHHDCWDKSTQIPKLAVFYWWFNDTDTKESCMNKFTSSMPQCNS